MSRWMSAKIVCLLAAAAFVVVFRVHASDNNAPIASAAPLTAARASALESDNGAAAKAPASKLVAVAALPALGHESKAKLEARKRAEAAARKARAHHRKVLAARHKAAAKRRAKERAAAAAAARRAAPATPARRGDPGSDPRLPRAHVHGAQEVAPADTSARASTRRAESMGMGSLPYGKSLLPRPLMLVAGIVAVLAAAAAGWFAADHLARAPIAVVDTPALNVQTGYAQLTLRSGWKLDAKVPKIAGLENADAKALAPADGGRGRMVVALVKGETADLPAPLVSALRVPAGAAEKATVGGQRGAGYTALSVRGVNGLTDLYTLHTAGGLFVIACVAPLDDPLPAGSCPADVTDVKVAVPAAPDPAAKLEDTMPSLTADLNKARVDGRNALRTGADSDAQKAAARSLQTAYTQAAATAAAVAPKSGKGADVPAVLKNAAAAYGALAIAAGPPRRPRVGCRAARRRRRGEQGRDHRRGARLVASELRAERLPGRQVAVRPCARSSRPGAT